MEAQKKTAALQQQEKICSRKRDILMYLFFCLFFAEVDPVSTRYPYVGFWHETAGTGLLLPTVQTLLFVRLFSAAISHHPDLEP